MGRPDGAIQSGYLNSGAPLNCGNITRDSFTLHSSGGIAPPNEFRSKFMDTADDRSPKELGITPAKQLRFRSNIFTNLREPIDEGTTPVKELTFSARLSKNDKLPMELGILPVNLFVNA